MDFNQLRGQAEEVAKQMIAERAKSDLYYLCKYILGGEEVLDPKVHGPLCKATRPLLFYDNPDEVLKHDYPSDWGREEEQGMPTEAEKQAFIEWQQQFEPDADATHAVGDKFDITLTNLLALMPRGTLKSTVLTIGFTIQFLLNYPNARVLIDSETFSKSCAFLAEIKGHYEKNRKLREIFFTLFKCYPDDNHRNDTWSTTAINLACRTRVQKEPSIDTAGIDTTKNGMHYDLAQLDDLHSEKNTKSAEQIQQVKDHRKLVYSLLDPGRPCCVIGTRWDDDDMYQEIIDTQYDDFNFITRKAETDDGKLLYPKRLNRKVLDTFRKIQGSYIFSCTPGDAEVLMGDFTRKPIKDVKVGDEVIGYTMGSSEKRGVLTKTIVSEVNSRIANIQKVYFESGEYVRCTPDHQWFTGRLDATHKQYLPAKVGRTMVRVLNGYDEPTPEEIADLRYLAGIIDGEGACKYNGSICITQSRRHNPAVYSEIKAVLDRLKIEYSEFDYESKECSMLVLKGGRSMRSKILQYGKPAKKDQILEGLLKYNSRIGVSREKVTRIEPDGRERVYALTTGTGNYVSQNFASKNCQYLNNPVDDATATFKRDMFKYISRDDLDRIPIHWYGLVDPSYKGKKSDYAALMIGGMGPRREIYARYVYRQKLTYAEIIDKMSELDDIYMPKRWLLEVIGTKSLEHDLERKQAERMSQGKRRMPVVYVRSRPNSKEDRIKSLSPHYERGDAYHVVGGNQMNVLEQELMRFPKSKNDDVSDCWSGILEVGQPPRYASLDEKHLTKRKSYIKMLNKPRSPMVGI